jgi:hypothetical protein
MTWFSIDSVARWWLASCPELWRTKPTGMFACSTSGIFLGGHTFFYSFWSLFFFFYKWHLFFPVE